MPLIYESEKERKKKKKQTKKKKNADTIFNMLKFVFYDNS